jgi:hypothetical protein
MNVEAILFASRAASDNWMLAVEGGAWEYVEWDFLPGTVSAYVAGVLTLDDDEHGSMTTVVLDLFDDAGSVEPSRVSITANGSRPKAVEGVPTRIPFAIPFTTVVNAPTVMKARLSVGEDVLAVIACELRTRTPDAPPPDMG